MRFIDSDGTLGEHRDLALAAAESEFIMFIDVDTRLTGRALAFALHRLDASKADVLAFHCRRFDSSVGRYVSIHRVFKTKPDEQLAFAPAEFGDDLFKHWDGSLDGKIFSVELLRSLELGFFARYNTDAEPLAILATANAKLVTFFNFPLAERLCEAHADAVSCDAERRISAIDQAMSIKDKVESVSDGALKVAFAYWMASICVDGIFDMQSDASEAVVDHIRSEVAPKLDLSLFEGKTFMRDSVDALMLIALPSVELLKRSLDSSESIFEKEYELMQFKYLHSSETPKHDDSSQSVDESAQSKQGKRRLFKK